MFFDTHRTWILYEPMEGILNARDVNCLLRLGSEETIKHLLIHCYNH